ncbi:hypothetical protein FDG94_gp067 [Pseudomonas phage SM1]|uniref:Uncharacterized protein n=1 Tax=Pseudomonas phage SM1 TaxID=1772332 RepID=A0A0U2SAL5_9CAUD|nr:hypothetical protein FDG94_gp067 [Pseudomonas phage SM1]ALT58060.1 hypothetical protein SM1_067 [Pseudomonas phage SM1]
MTVSKKKGVGASLVRSNLSEEEAKDAAAALQNVVFVPSGGPYLRHGHPYALRCDEDGDGTFIYIRDEKDDNVDLRCVPESGDIRTYCGKFYLQEVWDEIERESDPDKNELSQMSSDELMALYKDCEKRMTIAKNLLTRRLSGILSK